MKQRIKWLVFLALLVAGVSSLSATVTCDTTSFAGVHPCQLTGTSVSTSASFGPAPSCCALTSFNGTAGWHNFGNDATCTQTTAQAYLNCVSTAKNAGVTFSLSSNSNLQQGWVVDSWLNPTGDSGYYLETSQSITMTFGTIGSNGICTGCISQFALYWGSLDSWNTITFSPTLGSAFSLTGTQIANSLSLGTLGQNDTASFVLDFQVPSHGYLWTAVTVSSSSPAFEFDNIAYHVLSPGNCDGSCPGSAPTSATPVATPEPSGLLFLGTGIVGLVEWRRRRALVQG